MCVQMGSIHTRPVGGEDDDGEPLEGKEKSVCVCVCVCAHRAIHTRPVSREDEDGEPLKRKRRHHGQK